MKIDRSFLTHLPEKTKDSAIVSIMIQLAGSLGIDVIAEGVETGEQAAFLRAAGCPMGRVITSAVRCRRMRSRQCWGL